MSDPKKDYHKGKKINCYIPDEDYALLYEFAVEKGIFVSDIVRDSIHLYLMEFVPGFGRDDP